MFLAVCFWRWARVGAQTRRRACLRVPGPRAGTHYFNGDDLVCDDPADPVILVNTKAARNIPGRETDVSDAAALAQLASHGLLRSDGCKSRLAFNCAGKHASFLWACTENGWDTHSYREPNPPLQQRIRSVIESSGHTKIRY